MTGLDLFLASHDRDSDVMRVAGHALAFIASTPDSAEAFAAYLRLADPRLAATLSTMNSS